jgi:hypothetical protein
MGTGGVLRSGISVICYGDRLPALEVLMSESKSSGTTIIIIVVVVLGVLALCGVGVLVAFGALGFASFRAVSEAGRQTTSTDAASIRSAVVVWQMENPGRGCPDVDDLVTDGHLGAYQRTTDMWARPFSIECEGTTVRVVSNGADGVRGTSDDIVSE